MRIHILVAATLLLGPALPTTQALVEPPQVRFPDGYTAKLTFPGSVADLLLVPDGDGDIAVSITLFRDAGGWTQASMGATLRVFSTGATEADLVSEYFVSSATGPTVITFPASDLAGAGFYDVFVTFAIPTYPTSHHNIAKNLLLDQRLYNTAEYFDYHLNHRPLLLSAPAAPGAPGLPALPPEAACIVEGADPAACLPLPA